MHQRRVGPMLAAWLALAGVVAAGPLELQVGIGPFPYDLTQEAVDRVRALVSAHGNVYCVQLDNGIPWEAALSGAEFDAALMDSWRRHRDSIAAHHRVYLAIAPLAEDRTSWAPASPGSATPDWARDERQLTPRMTTAYARYVRRAVDYFRPTYLNIGVESGDMAAKLPAKWPLFTELFLATLAEVKKDTPTLQVGISSALQLLQMPGVLERARAVLDRCDYVGISFYPYMSEFYGKFGAARLPAPPQQWRAPLDWLAAHAGKPIAICETAYSSEDVRLERFGLVLRGSPALQSQFVTDLASFARRDRYLFTMFFLTVDYAALMEKLRPGDEVPRLWGHSGFFDSKIVEKPAWASYRAAWRGAPPPRPTPSSPPRPPPASAAPTPREIGFSSRADLFTAPAPDQVSLQHQAGGPAFMRWTYGYRAGQFAWATRTVAAGAAAASQGITFQMHTDRAGPLLVRVEEEGGESFFAVVTPPPRAWSTHALAWSAFTVEPAKAADGKLDPGRVIRVTIADGAALDAAQAGSRTVNVARARFQ